MKLLDAMNVLSEWDQKGRRVFLMEDLRKLFPDRSDKTFAETLRRLVAKEILERGANGVYINPRSTRPKTNLIEEIATALRRGCWSYVSLESALSEHGAISQIPISYLTVMTTGRSGVFQTGYGTIEFTHTKRAPIDIIEGTADVGRPLRLASPLTAWRDLQRVGRNLHMVSSSDLEDLGIPKAEAARGRQKAADWSSRKDQNNIQGPRP